ncbi:sensor histidine kinase [Planotetraspora sp. GP83]|uniref:sensor histidine kinase n=1 Tax=Planotetraspora sp. GP83 TaxID=3156264 RepID=UPI003513FA9A
MSDSIRRRPRITTAGVYYGLTVFVTGFVVYAVVRLVIVTRELEWARSELAEAAVLMRIAREASQEVRQVARGYREMSLAQEIDRAVGLLESSGVACRIDVGDVADAGLARPADETLAWAVREGITNVVRHSRAMTCSITVSRSKSAVRLELVNDNAPPSGPYGNGVTGLTERAAQLGGTVATRRTGDGRFHLVMELPTSDVGTRADVPAP